MIMEIDNYVTLTNLNPKVFVSKEHDYVLDMVKLEVISIGGKI